MSKTNLESRIRKSEQAENGKTAAKVEIKGSAKQAVIAERPTI